MLVGTTSFMSSQSFSQLITVNLKYNGIKRTKQCSDVNCVKSVGIQGILSEYGSLLCTSSYSVQTREKNSHKKKVPNTDTFHTVVRSMHRSMHNKEVITAKKSMPNYENSMQSKNYIKPSKLS